jgi:hypothetical protein
MPRSARLPAALVALALLLVALLAVVGAVLGDGDGAGAGPRAAAAPSRSDSPRPPDLPAEQAAPQGEAPEPAEPVQVSADEPASGLVPQPARVRDPVTVRRVTATPRGPVTAPRQVGPGRAQAAPADPATRTPGSSSRQGEPGRAQDPPADPAAPAPGRPSGPTAVRSLAVEDCASPPDAEDLLYEVVVLDCATPHSWEVFATYRRPDGPFPGSAELRRQTYADCQLFFEGYVGVPFWASSLDISSITPGALAWAEGDRTVTCMVVDLDRRTRTGSAKGSGT